MKQTANQFCQLGKSETAFASFAFGVGYEVRFEHRVHVYWYEPIIGLMTVDKSGL